MLKLYKKNDVGFSYWETWQDDNMLVVHSGEMGQDGETSRFPCSTDSERIVADRVEWLRSHDYAEIEDEALSTLSVQYILTSWGSSEDLEKRHRVEELLDEFFGWTGMGHCVGGEIGSGSMDVFCCVVDPLIALPSLVETLRQNDYLEGAAVTVETSSGFKTLWPESPA